MIKFLLWIYILILPAFCKGQQTISLDSLTHLLEKPGVSHTTKVWALRSALNHQKNNTCVNILRIKVFYGEKELKKIELQYRIAQEEVNHYLDSMKLLIKDHDYIFHYDRYNASFEQALFSIRKLNKLFEQYDYSSSSNYASSGIIESPKTIKKVIALTAKIGEGFTQDFDNHHDKLIREHGCFVILKNAYWYDWEDKRLVQELPTQKRIGKR